MGISNSRQNYERLEVSLEKLVNVTFHFRGSLYTGKGKRRKKSFAIMGLIDEAEHNWSDKSSDDKLVIRMNPTWVSMNEGYFLQYDLNSLASLPEKAFCLMTLLGQWREDMLHKGYILKRKVDYIRERMGMPMDAKRKTIMQAINRSVDQVNKQCSYHYHVSVTDDTLSFTYKSH